MHGLQLIPIALLALISSAVATASEKSARLRNGDGEPTATMKSAYYDRDTGLCTDGSLQLMSKDMLVALKTSWNEGSAAAVCEEPKKKSTPPNASYPRDAGGEHLVGATHLLLQLDQDGSISLAYPVCATDVAFAAATLTTVKTISFTPRLCDGVPVRSTVLLPFAYNP